MLNYYDMLLKQVEDHKKEQEKIASDRATWIASHPDEYKAEQDAIAKILSEKKSNDLSNLKMPWDK